MGHGVVVLPEKIFWHHIVQTNTLLDSQTTNTHPTITRKFFRVINRGHPQAARTHTLNRVVIHRIKPLFVLVTPGGDTL